MTSPQISVTPLQERGNTADSNPWYFSETCSNTRPDIWHFSYKWWLKPGSWPEIIENASWIEMNYWKLSWTICSLDTVLDSNLEAKMNCNCFSITSWLSFFLSYFHCILMLHFLCHTNSLCWSRSYYLPIFQFHQFFLIAFVWCPDSQLCNK